MPLCVWWVMMGHGVMVCGVMMMNRVVCVLV